jgi:hypothetical protein
VGWEKRSVPTTLDRDRIRGGHGAKGAFAHPTIRFVIASEAKQSILSVRGEMDCFASLAMTGLEQHP